ncbi:MAG TPA: type II toxin-antitoxin system VapC family toxin [Anaerolineales bacterium]|nr:type II toxin-antitoxin system VapC family toxin [Anaerolineales bacterium]
MVVLDTSALLLWTLDPGQLSESAEAAISGEEQIVVSSISIWEIALKVKRGKLVLPISIEEYMIRLGQVNGLEILAVDVQAWLDNVNLDWEHRDPADRTIVSLARRLDSPLVTSDATIKGFYPKTVW